MTLFTDDNHKGQVRHQVSHQATGHLSEATKAPTIKAAREALRNLISTSVDLLRFF
jgi:hypothetical protein